MFSPDTTHHWRCHGDFSAILTFALVPLLRGGTLRPTSLGWGGACARSRTLARIPGEGFEVWNRRRVSKMGQKVVKWSAFTKITLKITYLCYIT